MLLKNVILFSFFGPGFACLMDAKPDEQAAIPVLEVPQHAAEELQKTGYPEIEGDLAPSAMAPKAVTSLQKHTQKMQALIDAFSGASELSRLQTRKPSVLDGSGMLNMGIHITWVNAPWPIHSYGWPNW